MVRLTSVPYPQAAKFSGHDVERCPLLAASMLTGLVALGRRLEAGQKKGGGAGGTTSVWSAVVSSLRTETTTLSG
jgi:hypothetical protein